ncbi:cell wall anchor protein [Burkholderia gladioli]|uniref:cell wall anchor protein n=1 Tax=Burkholderia gladioli TaxID=28095 RepID=UPI0022D34C59|nr:cell wall anchor protein [Burkholderia gladioli]MDA0570166.1 cell wall anchor protein [Burkholderia gladioli]MDA0599856.1 cell wall anchor protein [Burkholderia gladioli]
MKRTVIAAAILASAATGSAHAANAFLYNLTGVTESVGIFGFVGLYGAVGVSSTAGAVINNNQAVTLNHVSLNPTAQSYTQGAITASVNNVSSSTSNTGTAGYSVGQGSSFNASLRTNSSQSSSRSGSSWVAGGSDSSMSSHQSVNANQSASLHQSANTGGSAFIAGGAAGATGSSQSTSASAYFLPVLLGFYAGSSTSQSASGYIVGEAGAVWGANSYKNASSNAQQHADISTNSTTHSSGDRWIAGASTSQSHSASNSSISAQQTSTEWHSTYWEYSNDYQSSNMATTGSLTFVTDTQQAGTLTATTGTNAATGVKGNLGINITEGIDNAQSNDVALASVDVGNVFGNAQIFSNQSSTGHASINNFILNASIGDGSLSQVSGNVGVNVSSGIGNVQNNSLAGSMTTVDAAHARTVAMVATDDNTQIANAQVNGRFVGTAMLGANTLTGATGNIGVNIAGGVGNLQHNGLAIAALNSGH